VPLWQLPERLITSVTGPFAVQGYCASCYAFAAAAAIESAVAIARKTTISAISPQPWVDCFWDFYGCGERRQLIHPHVLMWRS
jgi:hypothetical protein